MAETEEPKHAPDGEFEPGKDKPGEKAGHGGHGGHGESPEQKKKREDDEAEAKKRHK
jgi:hypothetical protein